MSLKGRKVTIGIAIVIGLVFLFAIFWATPDVAYAELSPSYVQNVQEAGLEWWSDLLALNDVKTVVDGWFSDEEMYDFSMLDNDPVVVAVIDSGIDLTHEAFVGHTTSEGASSKTSAYDVLYRDNRGNVIGRNTVSGNDNLADVAKNGHGTHVAGIVATLIHWLGLEKYIKIMPIMAGESNGNTPSSGAVFDDQNVKDGVRYALSHGADVVNLSIESPSSSEFDFVTPEWADQAIFVAAAGNGALSGGKRQGIDSAKQKVYPASNKYVIGVMNISDERDSENNLQLSESSNYGDAYDLCAPGTSIYSANNLQNDYIARSGTSMATPIVSFASALALLKFRALEAAVGVSKSMDEIRVIIKFSSTTYISKGNYQLGVFNMRKLVNSGDGILAKIDMESGLEKQQLGSIRQIDMRLHVLPEELEGEGIVEWMVDDQKIGEGFQCAYTPQKKVGNTVIYAYWTLTTAEGEQRIVVRHTIAVTYAKLTADELSSLKIGVKSGEYFLSRSAFEEGKSYLITFDGVDNYDPDLSEDFKWYVNGKLTNYGKEFSFTPERAGTYRIFLRSGTRDSNVCEIQFYAAGGRNVEEALTYASIAIVAVLALGLTATIVVIILRHKSKIKS